jgi:hypothetical protein
MINEKGIMGTSKRYLSSLLFNVIFKIAVSFYVEKAKDGK